MKNNVYFELMATAANYYAAKGRITQSQAVDMVLEGVEFANDKHQEAVRALVGSWLAQYAIDGIDEEDMKSDANTLVEYIANPRAAVWNAWDIRCEERFGQSVCPWAFDVTIPVPEAA